MTITHFQESVGQQAERLEVTPNLIRVRRKTLVSLFENKPLSADTPKFLLNATADDMLRALALMPVQTAKEAEDDGEEEVLWLVPSTAPPCRSLLTWHSTHVQRGRQLKSFMVPNLATCQLPYGYMRKGRGTIIPEAGKGAMVRQAFMIIAKNANGRRTIDWKDVASQINEQGSRRSLDRLWTITDVRELTRTTSYCGYVRFNDEGLGDAVEPLPEISEALIDLQTFIQAARVGPGKNEPWLRALEEILAQTLATSNES